MNEKSSTDENLPYFVRKKSKFASSNFFAFSQTIQRFCFKLPDLVQNLFLHDF